MGETEFRDAEPCCCGSGIAYAKCCKSERVKCLRDGRGRSSRFLIADAKLLEVVDDAKGDFYAAFGRKHESRDLLLNAALLYSGGDLRREFEKAARASGIPGHLLYAYRETDGLMLTKESYKLAPLEDREDWDFAVSTYLEAIEKGIDLNDPQNRSEVALNNFPAFLSNLVVHLGSYCHRAPISTRKNQPLFFQFLLLSQCHRTFKVIMDRFEVAGDGEVSALLRQIFEATVLIASLTTDPAYSEVLLAQALAGTEHYPYRTKKNGEPDYGRIVDVNSGREFESRVSFGQRARKVSTDDYAFFEVIYPDLSSGVHFDSGAALRAHMKDGRFLDWGRTSLASQFVKILVVADYLLTKLLDVPGVTKIIQRDIKFLRKRVRQYLYSTFQAFDEDDQNVDPNASLYVFASTYDYKIPE